MKQSKWRAAKLIGNIAATASFVALGMMSAPAVSFADPSGTLTIKEMKIGNPVFGTDGIRVGEINRIKANSDGRVTEIQVTTGGPTGLDAEVISISPDQIAQNGDKDVKLSLSAADVKKLPVLGEDQKG